MLFCFCFFTSDLPFYQSPKIFTLRYCFPLKSPHQFPKETHTILTQKKAAFITTLLFLSHVSFSHVPNTSILPSQAFDSSTSWPNSKTLDSLFFPQSTINSLSSSPKRYSKFSLFCFPSHPISVLWPFDFFNCFCCFPLCINPHFFPWVSNKFPPFALWSRMGMA